MPSDDKNFAQLIKSNLSSILIVTLLMLIVAATVFGYLFRVTENDLRRDMLQSTGAAATLVEGVLGQTVSMLNSAAAVPAFRQQDAEKASEYLADVIKNFPYYKGIAAVDAKGNVFASSDLLPNFNISQRSFFKETAAKKRITISDGIQDKIDNETIVVVAKPILDGENNLLVIVYALLQLDMLNKQAATVELGPKEDLYILDGNNVPLVHPNKQLISNRQKLPFGQQLRNADIAGGFTKIYNTKGYLAELFAFEKIEGTRWLVTVKVPRSYAINRMLAELAGPVLLFLLISSPIFFILIRSSIILNRKQAEVLETNRKLSRLVISDNLTGLYNHRHFHDRLKQLVEQHNADGKPMSLIMIDLDYFRYYNDAYGHRAGDQLLREVSHIIRENCRFEDILSRYGGEEFAVILPNTSEKFAVEIAEKIRADVACRNFGGENKLPMGRLTISVGVGCYPRHAANKDELLKAADQALYKAKFASMKNRVEVYYSVLDELKEDLKKSEENLFNTVKTLNSVIQAKDRYTYGHSERVMEYASLIAKQLGLDKPALTAIRYGAFLHDIGKIEIPAPLLNKPGKLTEEEYELIKQHPTLGADILKPLNQLRPAIPFVLYHHERFDGKGYPVGLTGKEIPLIARIGAVADSYDAMTTDRPYKPGKTPQQAVEELLRCSGSQFDPEIVKAFIKASEHVKLAK